MIYSVRKMQPFCGAFPVLPGKSEAAKEFAKTVASARRREYDESLKNQGITREAWFLQTSPKGDLIVVYFEAADVKKALDLLAKSQTPFDRWFKEQARAVTGVDLEQVTPPPEMIYSHDY